jgi:hypothetical protein
MRFVCNGWVGDQVKACVVMSAESDCVKTTKEWVFQNRLIQLGLGWISDRGGGLVHYPCTICRADVAIGYNEDA